MSTGLSDRSALHSLPVEIWKPILRLATLPSDQFEPARNDAFGWQFSGDPDCSSLTTKLAIALTCRYLWLTVNEFLYEAIIISRASDAQGLLDRIAEDARLQLRLSIESKVHVLILTPLPYEDVKTCGSACSRLISHCRNISSLKFCPTTGSRSTVVSASGNPSQSLTSSVLTLLSYIPVDNIVQLQELDIHVDFRVTGAGGITYTSILTNLAPSLRKLRLVGPMPRYIEAATLSFPNLTHLAVMRLPNGHRNVSRILQNWTFDSVTHFHVSSYMRDETVEAFWSTPRPNIIFLHLDQSLMVARTITNATPNLEVLEFVYTITWGDIWKSEAESYELPQRLKHVVVQTHSSIEPEDSSSLFIGHTNSFNEKLEDLAIHIQPFVNPRLDSLETFTVRTSLEPLRELGHSIDSLSQILGPGVAVLDTGHTVATAP